jgi:hypothetical protein
MHKYAVVQQATIATAVLFGKTQTISDIILLTSVSYIVLV